MGCGGEGEGEGEGGVVEGLRYEADLNMSCHGRESCLEFGSVYGTISIFSDFKFLRRERERDDQIIFCRCGWVWKLFYFELETGERQEKVSSRQGGPMGCRQVGYRCS